MESPRHAGEQACGQGSPGALPLDGPVGGGGGAVTHGRGPRLYVGGVPDDVQVRLRVKYDGVFVPVSSCVFKWRAGMLQLGEQHAEQVQASSSLRSPNRMNLCD